MWLSWKYNRREQRWCWGGVPGFIPEPGVICGLRCFFVSLLCSESFFSGFSGFPLSSKTNIFKFQFDPGMHGHVWTRSSIWTRLTETPVLVSTRWTKTDVESISIRYYSATCEKRYKFLELLTQIILINSLKANYKLYLSWCILQPFFSRHRKNLKTTSKKK